MVDWRRYAVPLALALALGGGVLLRHPSLSGGLRTDDYVQQAMLSGSFPLQRGPLDLYWFSGRDAGESAALLDVGYHPWWRQPGYRLSMLRPVTSGLSWLEHRLGLPPGARHAHSMLWWALLVAATAALLARLLSPPVAAIAVLLFSLDEGHGVGVSWIANRSALISATFGVLALLAHVRFRREGWRTGAVLSPLALSLALASGEYGLASVGYLLAFELWAPARAPGARARALGLGLFVVPTLLYLVAHVAGGYGVSHSGLYLSPLSSPLAFAGAVATRVPVLIGDLVLGVPAHHYVSGHPLRQWLLETGAIGPALWRALPSFASMQLALGVVAVAPVLWLLRRSWLGTPEASWLAGGSLLSLLPMAVSLPSERLLSLAAVGASALAALALWRGFMLLRGAGPALARPAGWVAIAAWLACLGVHVTGATLRSAEAARGWAARAQAERRWALSAPIAGGEDVVLIGASDFTTEAHVPWVRLAHGLPVPRSYRRLGGAQPYDLTRTDARTVELSALTVNLEGTTAGSLYRSRGAGLAAGARVALPGLEVSVLEIRNGEPTRVRFRFDRVLEDPTLRWLASTPRGLAVLRLPAPGETLRVPRAAVPR